MMAARDSRLLLLIGGSIALIVIAVVRVAAFGWADVAPDDARYLFVGLSLLDGHGPVSANGTVFLLRSPLYPAMLALGARAAGGDPIVGAHVVAAAIAVLGFVLAVVLAWRLGGPIGAIGAAATLASTPLLWRLVPTVRIDLAQAAAIVGLLLALSRPTIGRWVVGGFVLGVAVLIKESAATLLFLPLAFVRTVPSGRLLRLCVVYVVAAALTAGWWWVVVWLQAGVVFPANGLAVIERRQVGTDLVVGPSSVAVLALLAAGWVGVAIRARRDAPVRPLLVAGVLLVPPAAYATLNGLDPRNYAALAVLSAVAVGTTLAGLADAAAQWRMFDPGRHPARAVVAVGVAVALVGMAVVGGQAFVRSSPPQRLPAALTAFLNAHTSRGDRIVMTFRLRELVALELYGRDEVTELNPRRVTASDDPASYLWMGLRDRQLFGYDRAAWTTRLKAPATSTLAIVTPHVLAPESLLPILQGDGASLGLRPLGTVTAGDASAAVFGVDSGALHFDAATLALTLDVDAAEAWLALAGSDPMAGTRLAAARPIVVGDPNRTSALVSAVAGRGCVAPVDAALVDGPAIRLLPAGDPACR